MPKWYTRLPNLRAELKQLGKSYKDIEKGCELMITTLNALHKKQEKLNDSRLEYAIEETTEHFDFCKDFATGEIPKEEWEDYDFDGDLLGLFNDYLNEFWNICDTVVDGKYGDYDCTKFCWVEF